MTAVTASQQIDANSRTVTSNEAFVVSKTVAFDGTAGNGAQGTVALFTVTGDVLVSVFGYCTEDVAGATATISVGTSASAAGIIASTTATDIDNGEGWKDGAPEAVTAFPTPVIVLGGSDIIATVGTADITNGTIKLYCIWRPLSLDGNVVAA